MDMWDSFVVIGLSRGLSSIFACRCEGMVLSMCIYAGHLMHAISDSVAFSVDGSHAIHHSFQGSFQDGTFLPSLVLEIPSFPLRGPHLAPKA